MKKADKLNLAFGKCFYKSRLTPEECRLILDINMSDIISKHGLNEIQARQIKLWCKSECHRQSIDYLLDTREEASHTDTGYFRT
jgi:hypothetical protein